MKRFYLLKKNNMINLFKLLIFILIFFISVSCQKEQELGEGNLQLSKISGLISALKMNVSTLTLVNDNQVLVISPEMGGRIMGVSAEGIEGKNLLWVNTGIAKKDFLQADVPFVNSGGHRTWIAPEDAFYLDDSDEWFVPKVMDPGEYKVVESTEKAVVLSNKFSIKNKQKEEYNLELKREISIIENPPLSSSELPDGIKFVGYKKIHSLKNLSQNVIGEDIPFVGLWSLIQLNPPGTIIVPMKPSKKDKKGYRGYDPNFEPLLPERISLLDNVLSVKIDGKRREKIGISPESAKGCIAYLWKKDEDEGVLFIKKFNVEPGGIYLDGPWGVKRENGDAIQMYNDDGNMGGFAEIECHGPAKILKPEEVESHTIEIFIFTGQIDNLKAVGSKIMEIDLNKVKYF